MSTYILAIDLALSEDTDHHAVTTYACTESGIVVVSVQHLF